MPPRHRRPSSPATAAAPAPPSPPRDYRDWSSHVAIVSGREHPVATKPGVLAFGTGTVDPATLLLAAHVPVAPGDVVVHMSCGAGLFGAVAATHGRAGRVLLTDRSVVAVEAARRTLALNRAPAATAEVRLGQGMHALPAGLAADVVAIRIPHEKRALLQLLHDAFRVLRTGGRCAIAGATNEGVKSAATLLERLFGNAATVATDSGHRLVIATKRADAFADAEGMDDPLLLDGDAFHMVDATLRGRALTLFSRPGVFSWDHLDEATAILADVMEVRPGERVLDLGCGAGPLGTLAGLLSDNGPVTMVDADVEAVRSARRTADAAGMTRAEVLASDVAGAVLGRRFDVVVTNPPFHTGKATDLDVPMQFIRDAWTVLAPGGRLYLVANRTLPYERPVKWRFGNVATLHDGPRFKVLGATRDDGDGAP